MPAVIGGDRAYKVVQRGDMNVSFEWVNGEPAMILYPAHGNRRTAGAYVICLSSAFKYVKRNGYPDEKYCMVAAKTAADVMNFYPSRDRLFKIVDIILDLIPDLITMPPEPNWEKEDGSGPIIGELSIKEGDRVITQREITAPTEG